ncbi:hypothetical protein I6M49_00850 [Shewanella algae]|uniref:hypothetical protein n=1 Tax=Shewanella algae TaxID=38313 RepID=UPI001AAD968D|nr:hypothetical protein [Shewanella algae]MBO2652025.1 hypothetical protein [Shewanella algae]
MKIPFAYLSLGVTLFTLPVAAKPNEKLTQQCLDSFEIIKNQDVQAFVALMPYEASAKEQEHAAQILARSHKRWYQDKTLGTITPQDVSYSEPSKSKQQKGALQEARVKLLIEAENYRSSVSCKFLQTDKGWFLSKLP